MEMKTKHGILDKGDDHQTACVVKLGDLSDVGNKLENGFLALS